MKNQNIEKLKALLQTILRTKIKLSIKIHKILRQLIRAQSMPSTQPFISFKRVYSVSELRSPHRNLKDALTQDLTILREQLKNLELKDKSTKNKIQYKRAEQARRRFKKKFKKILQQAEKKGYLEEEEIQSLMEEAESILEKLIDILEVYPSGKKIRSVLKHMEISMLFDDNSKGNINGKSFEGLARASGKLSLNAKKRYARNPTQKNLKKFLKKKSIAQFLGGKDEEITLEAKVVKKRGGGNRIDFIIPEYQRPSSNRSKGRGTVGMEH